MKKRMYLLLFMLCMAVGAFAQDSSFTTGVLSKDKSNFSLIRVRIIQDTLGSWYLTSDARRFITGAALDAISKGKHTFYLVESSPMPRRTHLWGRELYREYNVVAEEGVIDAQFIGLKFGPAAQRGFLSLAIIISVMCFFVCFLFAAGFGNKEIKRIRIMIYSAVAILLILEIGSFSGSWKSILTSFDFLVLFSIIVLPSYLITFAFRKRRKIRERKVELEDDGYRVDKPEFVFEDGSRVLTNKFIKLSKDIEVIFVDKNYHQLKSSPYTDIYEMISMQNVGGNRREVSKKMPTGKILSGYVDKTGKVVIPIKFTGGGSFFEGKAQVLINGSFTWIDESGKQIILKPNGLGDHDVT